MRTARTRAPSSAAMFDYVRSRLRYVMPNIIDYNRFIDTQVHI